MTQWNNITWHMSIYMCVYVHMHICIKTFDMYTFFKREEKELRSKSSYSFSFPVRTYLSLFSYTLCLLIAAPIHSPCPLVWSKKQNVAIQYYASNSPHHTVMSQGLWEKVIQNIISPLLSLSYNDIYSSLFMINIKHSTHTYFFKTRVQFNSLLLKP